MGYVTNNGTLATNDLQSIQDRSVKRTTTTGAYRWGDTQAVWTEDFDGSYDPINSYRQSLPRT